MRIFTCDARDSVSFEFLFQLPSRSLGYFSIARLAHECRSKFGCSTTPKYEKAVSRSMERYSFCFKENFQ